MKTFAKQVAPRPDDVIRLVDTALVTKSAGSFRTDSGLAASACRRALAGIVVLVSLAACGNTSSTASETTHSDGSTNAPTNVTEAVQVTTSVLAAGETTVVAAEGGDPIDVPELLQFTAPLVGGGDFNGAERAGSATAFWFWAPT